ncbi:hypothetical protein T281_16385 [Rhodomicrobium udaipurense JA643]|nr:hypothetical protein T281_16385 [Rhodomicrobium udaipurense JA643]
MKALISASVSEGAGGGGAAIFARLFLLRAGFPESFGGAVRAGCGRKSSSVSATTRPFSPSARCRTSAKQSSGGRPASLSLTLPPMPASVSRASRRTKRFGSASEKSSARSSNEARAAGFIHATAFRAPFQMKAARGEKRRSGREG